MTKSTSLTFALILSMATMPAMAQDLSTDDDARGQERPSHWQRFSERFDADADGVVTQDEFQRNEERFSHLDSNSDGQLTEEDFAGREGRFERRGPRGPRGAGLIVGADADQSGSVTREEWQSFISALDGDGDGSINEAELKAFHEVRAEGAKRKARQGSRGGSALKRLDGDQSGGFDAAEQEAYFASLDGNGDGTVSAEEMPRRRRGRGEHRGGRGHGMKVHLMKQADADQDGQLAAAEWQSFIGGIDVDNDGSLSRDELASARPSGAPEPPADAPAIEVSRLDALFTLLDANTDGVIAEDEWPRRGRRGPRRN